MSNESAQTLGQRIDAVLEPLYAEAEQHRATIAEVTEQQQALQEKIDSAEQGLSQIESRMAEVVRSLAGQEPVIAAVVGEPTASTGDTTPIETTTAQIESEPVLEAEPEIEFDAGQVEVEAEAAASLAEEVISESPAEPEEPAIELDPVADAQAVSEAAAMLDALPTEPEPAPAFEPAPEPDPEPAPVPAVDLAAAAERAAAAAKQLRDKAAAK